MSEQQKIAPEQAREAQENQESLQEAPVVSPGQPEPVQAAAGTFVKEDLAPAQEFRKNPRKRANAFGQDEPRMASHVQITNQAFIEKLKKKKAERGGLPGGPDTRAALGQPPLAGRKGPGKTPHRIQAGGGQLPPGQAPRFEDFAVQPEAEEQVYFPPQEQVAEYSPQGSPADGAWTDQQGYAAAQLHAASPPPPPPPHQTAPPPPVHMPEAAVPPQAQPSQVQPSQVQPSQVQPSQVQPSTEGFQDWGEAPPANGLSGPVHAPQSTSVEEATPPSPPESAGHGFEPTVQHYQEQGVPSHGYDTVSPEQALPAEGAAPAQPGAEHAAPQWAAEAPQHTAQAQWQDPGHGHVTGPETAQAWPGAEGQQQQDGYVSEPAQAYHHQDFPGQHYQAPESAQGEAGSATHHAAAPVLPPQAVAHHAAAPVMPPQAVAGHTQAPAGTGYAEEQYSHTAAHAAAQQGEPEPVELTAVAYARQAEAGFEAGRAEESRHQAGASPEQPWHAPDKASDAQSGEVHPQAHGADPQSVAEYAHLQAVHAAAMSSRESRHLQEGVPGHERAGGDAGAGPEGSDSHDNGRQRVRIPWDENAVQEIEYGEGKTHQSYQGKIASGYDAEKERTGSGATDTSAPYAGRPQDYDSASSSTTTRSGGYMFGGTKGGQVPPGSGGGDGAWLWLPQGIEQRRPWRKRHPFLFWALVILLGILVFNAGRFSMKDIPVGGPRLAVINLEGVILDADDVLKWIEKIGKDDNCKGALLRVNSPGGAVGPSQEIYAAIKKLSAKKPVVASLGTLAASGGYYAALGAREIVAGPSTITGSIGIKMQVPNVEGLMRTLGVSERTLVSGAYKDAGSVWRKMSKEEEEYFYAIMDDMYEEFVGVVAQERKISMADMSGVADGKAMTGRQALLHKLVDSLGDKQDALSRLKALCRIDDSAHVILVEGPRQKNGFLKDLLLSMLSLFDEQRSVSVQPMYIY